MSRRHHGRPNNRARGTTDAQRRAAAAKSGTIEGTDPAPQAPLDGAERRPADMTQSSVQPGPATGPTERAFTSASASPAYAPPGTRSQEPNGAPNGGQPNGAPNGGQPNTASAGTQPNGGASHNGGPQHGAPDRSGQCTAPQLRRFIKSRPYVPMHELRRRFGIDGADDDVTGVRLEPGWIYVGLPSREGGLLGELLRAGEIGYELSLDPRSPIVIGVYPMRPIPRS
jgi:hypothetical protein